MKVKLYLPTSKSKTKKSKVRGFWRNEQGRIFYDYIKTVNVDKKDLKKIRKDTGEEALFYIDNDIAYIYTDKKTTALNNCNRYIYIKNVLSLSELKAQFKKLLKQYGGFTVYNKDNCYLVEVWL